MQQNHNQIRAIDMKKKVLLLLSFCLTCLLSAQAETCLMLQMRDGQTHSYVLSQQPVLTFSEGAMTLKTSEAEASFLLTEIENYHFAQEETELRTMSTNERRFSYIGGIVKVEGGQDPVLLSDLNGRILHTAQRGETFSFDLHRQQQGTYLLRIGSLSIKLYHK